MATSENCSTTKAISPSTDSVISLTIATKEPPGDQPLKRQNRERNSDDYDEFSVSVRQTHLERLGMIGAKEVPYGTSYLSCEASEMASDRAALAAFGSFRSGVLSPTAGERSEFLRMAARAA